METYATWARLFELLPYYSWIVDRFHLSTRAEQRRLHGSDPDFGWLEARLRPLGFRIVLCTRREETFAAARAERLTVSGKPDQYDDLGVFVREQALLRELAERPCSPCSISTSRTTTSPPPPTGSPTGWRPPAGSRPRGAFRGRRRPVRGPRRPDPQSRSSER